MRKWFLVIAMGLVMLVVSSSCLPVNTSMSPEPHTQPTPELSPSPSTPGTLGSTPGSIVTPVPSPTDLKPPEVDKGKTSAPATAKLTPESAEKIEVANLSKQEINFLGKGIREVVSHERLKETDLQHKLRLSSLDEMAIRLEKASDDDIINIIQQETESQESIKGLATVLAGEISAWAAGAAAASLLSPPVLIAALFVYPAAVIISEPVKTLTEWLTMGSVGSFTLRNFTGSETIIMTVVYDRKASEAIIDVGFYPVMLTAPGSQVSNSPSEIILMMIPFKRIFWNENAGSTMPVLPEYGGDEIDWAGGRVWVHFKSNPAKIASVTLTVYVHENSASGLVIAGAQVAGQDGDGASFSQTTNPNGYVTITGVPGTWSFTASKSGYDTNSWSQSITATDTKHAYLVKTTQKPNPPTPVSPGSSSEPGVVISTLTPTLQWSGVSGADYYALAISKYPYGSNNIVYNPQQLIGSSHAVPDGILESGQKYRWNMQAHNNAGWSDVSSNLYFQTAVANITLTLYVHENSASGPVIAGATVTGQDGAGVSFSQTTNSNGYVTITGTPGTWSFTVSKSGYDTNSWQQSITATNTKHAYLMKQVSNVTLTLYIHENSASGPVISRVSVVGQDGEGSIFSQVTNSSGYVTITGAPGTWSFTSSKSGYDTNSWSQSITADGTKHAYLMKEETPSYPPTLIDVGIASRPWPPQTFLQAGPGDTIYTLYTFSYSGPNILVNLKTAILDTNGNEIGNQVSGPGLWIINPFENPITGVGVEYKLSGEAIPGTYDVKFSIWSEDDAQQYDSVLKSGWLRLALEEETETISTPEIPTGPSTGEVNQSLTYSTGGASSSLGHSLEYRFDWGDGSYSDWSPSTTASHSWSSQGTCVVRVQARCATHTSIVSGWSSGPSVNITPPTSVSASIDSYAPSSTVQVTVGSSTTISVTFTNTGNTEWSFIAGATVWDSNGNQVANYSKTLSTSLQPSQQTTVSWTHPVNQAGDYWLQFGVWKDGSTLLSKVPSPSQKFIVGNEPATFNIGDRVRVTTNLNVRTGAGTSYPEISDPDYPGYAPAGTTGTVLSGPVSANGYIWWQIQYDAGYTGWSVEGGLERV